MADYSPEGGMAEIKPLQPELGNASGGMKTTDKHFESSSAKRGLFYSHSTLLPELCKQNENTT